MRVYATPAGLVIGASATEATLYPPRSFKLRRTTGGHITIIRKRDDAVLVDNALYSALQDASGTAYANENAIVSVIQQHIGGGSSGGGSYVNPNPIVQSATIPYAHYNGTLSTNNWGTILSSWKTKASNNTLGYGTISDLFDQREWDGLSGSLRNNNAMGIGFKLKILRSGITDLSAAVKHDDGYHFNVRKSDASSYTRRNSSTGHFFNAFTTDFVLVNDPAKDDIYWCYVLLKEGSGGEVLAIRLEIDYNYTTPEGVAGGGNRTNSASLQTSLPLQAGTEYLEVVGYFTEAELRSEAPKLPTS